MKVYSVHFQTESGDDYYSVFREKPTDGHLSAYVKENFPDEIRDGERLIYWTINVEDLEELPEPIDPIPSI